MKIIETSVYRGPNVYALFPVIRHTIDLGELEHWPTGRLGSEYVDSLIDALPGLHVHGCSYGEPGGFIRRMREDEGTWLGHVMEHLAIELQNVAGTAVTFGKTRSTGDPGHYHLVYQFENEEVGLEAGRLALELLHESLPAPLRPVSPRPEPFVFDQARDNFIRYAQRRALGPSTASLVKAAEERGIPWLRLNEHSLIQLGHGRFQQRIQATITGKTSYIAVQLASDKEATHKTLADLGLPVPKQQLVHNVQHAIKAAGRIGYPVVTKPVDGNHGRGVTIEIESPEQLEIGFEKASAHSSGVIVESYIHGLDHRLLVVNNELIAAAKRVPGHVVGDGKRSVEALVDEVNSDPRRGVGHEKVLTRLEFDHQADRLLSFKGYNRTTVPEAGEIVYLRSTANLSTGGTSVDVTDDIHPDNRDMAVRSIKAVGLDVGGVDFICTDIAKSYRETGGAICEINAAPGFRMHVAPSEGTPRDVAGPVIDMLFPPGAKTQIPIAAITGTNGKTTTSRMLAHIMKLSGHTVGMTSTDGVYIDGRVTVQGDMTGPMAARMVLSDASVDAAVLETARGGLLRRGLGYRRSSVSACLNISDDHLGLKGVETLEDLAEVKRVVIEVAQDASVLNADDALCLRMADYSQAKKLCYVTMNHDHPLVREHIRAGGLAVVLEHGINGHMITLYDENGHHIPLLWSHLIPATLEGRALHNVQNAMFAAAMAYCLGIDLENIRQGLLTFNNSFFQVPGRLNVYDEHPFKVIMDYAHNPAAIKSVTDLVDRFDIAGKKIVVLTAPGDRRDQDIAAMAETVAGHFDYYICRRDDNARGRGPTEVPDLLKKTLLEQHVDEASIEIIPNEQDATLRALQMGAPGDLLLILADAVARTWKQIIYFTSDDASKTLPATPAHVEIPPETFSTTNKLDDFELIRDERGVRVARQSED